MSSLLKALDLLTAATPAELDALPPTHQRRAAEILRHWSMLADSRTRAVDAPRSGIRAQLARGERSL